MAAGRCACANVERVNRCCLGSGVGVACFRCRPRASKGVVECQLWKPRVDAAMLGPMAGNTGEQSIATSPARQGELDPCMHIT